MSQIDVERALQSLDGNMELLKCLAGIFVEDAPILLNDLKIAIRDNHPLQARSAMHGLKGMIAIYFAKPGLEIAQRLENYAIEGNLKMLSSGEFEKLETFINLMVADFANRGWIDHH